MTGLPIRDAFDLPEGLVYLDGNSLGPLPKAAKARMAAVVTDEWGDMLIRGWNAAGWIDLPNRVGDRIARLIGAPRGSVIAADSTSVNLFKVLSAALAMRPDRKVIVSERGNFPTDLYVAQQLAAALGQGHTVRLVDGEGVSEAISEDVAVVMLTQVDYRSGRRHDMGALTARAHAAGALMIWDLAHSAGAFDVDLTGAAADFAIGCGYKYLNGGPGAPAFVYVRPDHVDHAQPALGGWMGHAAPFDFVPDYSPATGIQRLAVGTPPVLSLSALDAALELWDRIDIGAVRAASIALTERFIAGVEAIASDHPMRLASPRSSELRGSQVSFHCAEGYAVMQALIAAGVIGDFRAPDIIRFGFAPLYNTEADVDAAIDRLGLILRERHWDRPEFKARAKVT